MTHHNLHDHTRRPVAAVLATLLAVAGLAVGVPAPAQAAVYAGSITAAYADNPLPRLSEVTGVHFIVSLPLLAARVTVVDEDGKTVWTYSKGTDCGYGTNPAPGETKTYTAHLTVQADGAWVEVATASVSVTDPGFRSGFTAAYADNPSPKLSESTRVTFMLEAPMDVVASGVVIYDEDGTKITNCGSKSYAKDRCVVSSNPAPGETKTYTAHLTAQGDGAWFEVATASVSVTDPGFSSGFTSAYADNPTPKLSESTYVTFMLEAPMNVVASGVVIYDEDGTKIANCGSKSYAKDRCVVSSNPAPGETKTYTAHLTAQGEGAWFEVATASVSVTDPGWQGTISPAVSNRTFIDPGGSTTVNFDVSEPLESASVKVYVDGVYQRTCSTVGQTACGVAVQFADAVPHLVTATVEAEHALGWVEVSSASQVVTTQTAQKFADWLLDPATDLGELATPELMGTLAALRSGVDIAEACYKAGVLIRENEAFHGTPADVTLACNAAGLTASGLLATIFAAAGLTVGLDAAIHMVAPTPPTRTTVAGGGRAENMPNVDGYTGCSNFDLAGNCLDPWKLTSLSTEHVSFTADPVDYWGGSTVLCSANYIDPDTGEEQAFTLRADGLEHIVGEHGANPDNGKSIWDSERFFAGLAQGDLADFQDELEPTDFDRLVQFICTALAFKDPTSVAPSSVEGSPNVERVYDREGIVGTNQAGFESSLFTLVVTPAGDVWTAHPGLPENN